MTWQQKWLPAAAGATVSALVAAGLWKAFGHPWGDAAGVFLGILLGAALANGTRLLIARYHR